MEQELHHSLKLQIHEGWMKRFAERQRRLETDMFIQNIDYFLRATKILDLPLEVPTFVTDPIISGPATVGLGWHGRKLTRAEAMSLRAMAIKLEHSGAPYHSVFVDGASTSTFNGTSDLKGKVHVASATENDMQVGKLAPDLGLDGDGFLRGSLTDRRTIPRPRQPGRFNSTTKLNDMEVAWASDGIVLKESGLDGNALIGTYYTYLGSVDHLCQPRAATGSFPKLSEFDHIVKNNISIRDSLQHVYIDMPPEEGSNSMISAARESWVLSEPVMQVVGQATGAALSQVMANATPDAAPWLMVLVKTTALVGFACTFAAVGFKCHRRRVISPKVSSAMAKLGAIATASAVILSMGMALPAALGLPLGTAAWALITASVALA